MDVALFGVIGVLALGGVGGPAERVEQDSLMGFLRELPVRRSPSSSDEHRAGLIRTQDLIADHLRGFGYEPKILPIDWPGRASGNEPDRPALDQPWHNIAVELPGREHPERVLIVGAHFDAVPASPGADDNGTGTAALLEIARVLRGVAMERTVRLIFFNLEEPGLIGSSDYVRRRLKPELARGEISVIGMASLEMLGYFTDEPGSQRSPVPAIEGVYEPPETGDFIAVATIAAFKPLSRRLSEAMRVASPDLNVFAADFFPVAPPDLLRSDHAPFLFAGVPSVIVTDTSNFRNPNYHSSRDTIETIDAERFTMVVRGLAGGVEALAGAIRDEPGEARPDR